MSILDFFRRKKSANTAKERLKMVLSYERKDLPPSFRENLQKDIMDLFKKYPQLNASGIEINFKTEDGKDELYISVPFSSTDADAPQSQKSKPHKNEPKHKKKKKRK